MNKQELPYWLTIVPTELRSQAEAIIAAKEAELTAIVPHAEYGNVDAILALQGEGILTEVTEEQLDAIHEMGQAGEIEGHARSVDLQINEQLAASL